MQLRIALIEHLAEIVKERVKPMEKIDGIKIFQLDGLQRAAGGGDGQGAPDGSLADQIVNSALRYRGQAPLVDMLMSEIGLKSGDISGLTQALNERGKVLSGNEADSNEPENE